MGYYLSVHSSYGLLCFLPLRCIQKFFNLLKIDPPLLSSGEAASLALCPVLGSPVQERPGHAGRSPAEGHQGKQGPGATLLWGEAERAGTAQPGEEQAQGGCINVCEHLEGGCKEDGARLL